MITGLSLTEISVVDRPANPEAVFDCWKRAPQPPDAAGRTKSADTGVPPAARVEPAIRTAGVPPACRPVDQRLGAGAPGRLRVLLAELCGLLNDDEALAALAVPDTLRKQRPTGAESFAAGLARLADDILPRLDALQRRVDDIAKTPLPPLTASRGLSAIAKRDDGSSSAAAPPDYPNADIVTALARMTEEERTLTLIKAAHATPLYPTRWRTMPVEQRH